MAARVPGGAACPAHGFRQRNDPEHVPVPHAIEDVVRVVRQERVVQRMRWMAQMGHRGIVV